MNLCTDQDAEFQRILSEIKWKNGLPLRMETNQVGKESDRNSMESYYTNSQLRAIRRKGDKDEKRRQAGDVKRSTRIKFESQIKPEKEAKPQQVTIPDQASGKPALIQSTYGNKGNFELVVPWSSGGLAHYSRNNDQEGLPWSELSDSELNQDSLMEYH